MRFSVIVPVYNVERYLDECVRSLLDQTFTDFEIILVDDCSPDGSPALCDLWAKRDGRIRVIHKPENQGLGFARNTGVEAARGEYVLFVDSDDFVSADTLETCDRVLSDGSDILVFGMELFYENKNGEVQRKEGYCTENHYARAKEELADMFVRLSRDRVFPYACNKVYRRAFLEKAEARFEKTKLIEDFLFNIDLFGKAEAIRSVSDVFYHYRKPAHETLASQYSPEFFELSKRKFLLEEEFLKNCNAHFGIYQHQIHCGYVKHLVSAVIRNGSKASGLSRSDQKKLVCVMLSDPITIRVMEEMKPEGIVYNAICFLIRTKCATLFLLLCTLIDGLRRLKSRIF
jgi:glycosyltransferase involved in cell wall biosynthesis